MKQERVNITKNTQNMKKEGNDTNRIIRRELRSLNETRTKPKLTTMPKTNILTGHEKEQEK